MGKFLKILFCFVVVDFYFFSTKFSFSHGYNTKELLAVMGIFLFLSDLYQRRKFAVTREFLGLLIYSGLISLMAVFSATVHNTKETLYTTYFLSMLVWLSASYTAIRCIKAVHGKLSVELVATYIVGVSVAQGLIAVIADNYAPLSDFIVRVIPGVGWSRTENRLFGFGDTTTFDTGGIRFALASILCAHNIKSLVSQDRIKPVPLYIVAFIIICLAGNMVARTTIVGTFVGLGYLLLYLSPFKTSLASSTLKAWMWIIMETLVVVSIISIFYNTNENFRKRTRFAFEGFFSLVEQGRWQTGSNDTLKSMYVYPNNAETWIIGDGYFNNPKRDPNYLGNVTAGYYMHTDVGFLRFIFFFGLIGLGIYSMYIIYAGRVCNRMHPGNTLLFIALTSMNFVVWLKVATDCFFILCLFISLGYVMEGMREKGELIEE